MSRVSRILVGIICLALAAVWVVLAPITGPAAPIGVWGILLSAALAAMIGFSCIANRPLSSRMAAGGLCLVMTDAVAVIALSENPQLNWVAIAATIALMTGLYWVSGIVSDNSDTMKTHVEFRSDQFPPYDEEDDEINPGIYGKRLAEFLVRGLKEQGWVPEELIAEDWGWIVPIQNEGFDLWIGCANYAEYPDGFLCVIEPHRPSVRPFPFLWKVDTTAKIHALQQAINDVLCASPAIRDIRWWTYDEFMHQGRQTGS
jgi:hypothetical protein